LGKIALVQAISPIATHISVAWSVCLSLCRLSHSCSLLQWIYMRLNSYTCGVQWHIVLDGGPWPTKGREDLGVEPQPKVAIAYRDSPEGSTIQRFHVLSNYFSPSCDIIISW